MAQPILPEIYSWDSIKDKSITFSYSGNQVFKNQVVIRDNITNTIVYDQTQVTFQLKHVIAATTLANGNYYNLQLRVFDKDDVPSPYSKTEIFCCLASPTFSFLNLTENQIIQNSFFQAQLAYSQVQNEPLNNYQFILYNEHQIEIARSGTFYNTSSLSYTFSNLEDKGKYFFRATGETLNHMVVDTGMITASVRYSTHTLFTKVDLDNLAKMASIRIRSNIVSITGKSNPDPPIYLNDTEVDLRDPESWVKFDEGFEISGDFTAQIKARDIINYSIPLILSNESNEIVIKFMKGTFASQGNIEKAYFELTASNSIVSYVTMSNYLTLPIANIDSIYIWIRRINNVYELKAVNLGGGNI